MTVKEVFETMDYGPAPESDSNATEWLERHKRSFKHFIGGKFVGPSSGETFQTLNPADGSVLAQVAQGDEKDIDKAVKAARKAQSEWGGIVESCAGEISLRASAACPKTLEALSRFRNA